MKQLLQTLTLLAILFAGRTAIASGDSSFILNGATALEGGGLSLTLSTNHFGEATTANFYLSHIQPIGRLSELKKGLSIGKLKMNPGATLHTITITPAQVKALGTPKGVAVYVTAHWPKFAHIWGETGRPKQSFKFPKLKVAPKASSTRSASRNGTATSLSRRRPKRKAARVR